MSDEHELDDMRDRMVRALYDELPASDRQALDERLAIDPELRGEMHDLSEARRLLASLAEDLPGRHGGEVVGLDHVPGTATRGRWLRRAAAAAVGFAAAATVFVGLLVAGLRIDRTPAGVLVRFGGAPTQLQATAVAVDELVTRDQLAAVASSLAAVTATRMDQLERRQAGVQAELTNALYDAIAVRQQRQYEDLRYRIERTAAQVGSWYPSPAGGQPTVGLEQGGRHAID